MRAKKKRKKGGMNEGRNGRKIIGSGSQSGGGKLA